jgi:hypothetical protein
MHTASPLTAEYINRIGIIHDPRPKNCCEKSLRKRVAVSKVTPIMNTETEKQELQKKKSALILSKREHETKLVAIKNVVRSGGKLPNEKYKQCCDAQNTHSRAILHIEKQLASVKLRLREIADLEFKSKNGDGAANYNEPTAVPNAPVKSIVSELVALRQEYQAFAADGTRVSSMRQMAAEFVLKLNPVIRQAIGVD